MENFKDALKHKILLSGDINIDALDEVAKLYNLLTDSSFSRDFYLVSSRYRRNKNDWLRSVKTTEEYNVEVNKITLTINDLIDSIQENVWFGLRDAGVLEKASESIRGLRRFQVGNFSANVYLGLLPRGTYDHTNFSFSYSHEWVSLPDEIENQRETIISRKIKESKFRGVPFFNGPCIRLHNINIEGRQMKDGQEKYFVNFELRPTSWFDYELSNNRLDDYMIIEDNPPATIRSLFANEGKLASTRTVNWLRLSNILTVTVVLVTSDNYLILGVRDRVSNFGGAVASSAAENMHRWKDEPSSSQDFWSVPNYLSPERFSSKKNVDFNYAPDICPNPFYTAIRGVREEVSEEIGATIDPKQVKFIALAWDILSFNPHLYSIIKIDQNLSEVQSAFDGSRATDSFESILFPVKFEPAGKLKDLLLYGKWAPISKGAVIRALCEEYGFNEVKNSSN